ncbi:MAG: prepilin-type N-terminal cleavage/methylation domain-containing protein [Thermodesulfobacteriota bacterium]|nr:prepilin-type N-terminal cleavage/methylation domain-containing protein [Thermodesulfobacteriota bacterium]
MRHEGVRMLDEKGFTLIEILIAIAIFAFGILAIAAMQIKTIQGNSFAGGMTGASHIAQNKMEELIALPFNDAQLNDANDDRDAGLDKPTNNEVLAAGNALIADGVAGSPDYAQQILGPDGIRNYYVYWNVSPVGNSRKTVSVIVAWHERGMHRIALSYIKF